MATTSKSCFFIPISLVDPTKETGRLGRRPVLYVQPPGDWLPSRHIECSTQVGGGFGLANLQFPGHGVAKHDLSGVEKLAPEPQPPATGPPAVLGISAHGMVDRGEEGANMVGATGF